MDVRSTYSKLQAHLSNPNATTHWLSQRITAILLIPLSYWILVLLKLVSTAPYQTTLDWLTSPVNAIAMLAWLALVFYHAALGVQVVIEDYVSHPRIQTLSIRMTNSLFLLLAIAAITALFKILFTR